MTRSVSHSARIAPAALPLDDDVQAAIDRVMRGKPAIALFTTVARDRRLFDRFFGGGLLDRGHLTLREREIVIDRVTARCGAEYEWGVHVATFGAKAGLDDAQTRSLVLGDATDTCWDDEDGLLIELCDALHDTCDVDDDLWERLRAVHSEDAVLELLMLAGNYRMVSLVVKSLRLPLEDGAARFPG